MHEVGHQASQPFHELHGVAYVIVGEVERVQSGEGTGSDSMDRREHVVVAVKYFNRVRFRRRKGKLP